jgi:hypothetical protein
MLFAGTRRCSQRVVGVAFVDETLAAMMVVVRQCDRFEARQHLTFSCEMMYTFREIIHTRQLQKLLISRFVYSTPS